MRCRSRQREIGGAFVPQTSMSDADKATIVRDFERLMARGRPGIAALAASDDGTAPPSARYFQALLQALPAAVYATDAEGRIIFYNDEAVRLWGCRPEPGRNEFCGSWKLYWPDGRPLPHDECPMALALKTRQPVRGMEAVAERPDGTRIPFVPYPTPLFDEAGALIGAVNMLVDITGQRRTEERLRDSEARYRGIFDNARVAVWEEDFSAVIDMLDKIRADGVEDLRAWLRDHPGRLAEAIGLVRVTDVNDFTVELFEADCKQTLLGSLADVFLPETEPVFVEELVALWEGCRRFESETILRTLRGRRLDVVFTMAFEGARAERTLVSVLDISARKHAERTLLKQTDRLEALNRIAKSISSNLELEHIVQAVTDFAADLSGARFGAFFYNVQDDQGGHYQLYTLSGAPRSAFEKLGLPRATAVFEPTFLGTGVVRSDDIRLDPRYGRNPPHHGMPAGHLPVVSYLAVPVVSRSGAVHGGLFLGHDRPGIFTQEAEDIVTAIGAQAAVAIDNARLLKSAQAEIAHRRRADQAAQQLAAIVESSDDAIVSKDLDGVITTWNRGAENLFGYTEREAVGRPITMLIPPGRDDEEPTILARVRRGEPIDHYETVRRRKDGTLIDISLSVSPIRDADGVVTGASKIARDITDRRRAQEQQELLIREMGHRVKNLFAVASSVVALSARDAGTPQEMATALQGRLGALTRAHDLTRPGLIEPGRSRETSLQALVRTILSPYVGAGEAKGERIVIVGPDVPVGGNAVTSLALILHEMATNAAKYGALSSPVGSVLVASAVVEDVLRLTWTERGGPKPKGSPQGDEGFGGQLVRRIISGQFSGTISRDWQPDGLVANLSIPLARLAA